MKRGDILLAIILVLIGFGLYSSDLGHTLFFDDEFLIKKNAYIHPISAENVGKWFTESAFAGAGRASEYYRPLLLASFAANYAIHGDEPFGYFLVNNLLHALTGILVFMLIMLLFQRRWLAFLTALIYVAHPVQSENVALVAGRGDLLGIFFILLGLIAWVYWLQRRQTMLALTVSSLFLILALLSHEVSMVFPFLGVVLYVAFVTRENVWRSCAAALVRVVPHLLIVATYLALRLTVLNFRDFLNFGNYDQSAPYAQDVLVRFYTFLPVVWEYVRMFFWPAQVHLRFTYPIHTSLLDWPVWPVFLSLCGLAALLWWLYTKEPHGTSVNEGPPRVSDFRLLFFGAGWFFVALVPSSGIIPTNVIIHDHRMALAMIGLAALFLCLVGRLVILTQARGIAAAKYIAFVFFAIWIGWVSTVTLERSRILGDHEALFLETLRYESDALIAHNMLGILYMDSGQWTQAKEHLTAAVISNSASALPYYNLGYFYQIGPEKNEKLAEALFLDALKRDPRHWSAHWYLAQIYMEQGKPEAIGELLALHTLRPHDANIHYNLAAMYDFLGEKNEALRWVDEGLLAVGGNDQDTIKFEELRRTILARR